LMRKFTPFKRAFRVLGIAESFKQDLSGRALLAGVVMRADGIIDGFTFGTCTLMGMDSTEAIIEMYRSLSRDDINLIMLNGCIISLFNIIDLNMVSRATDLPLLCVTYYPSEGISESIKRRFPDDWERRLSVYEANGPREEVKIRTSHTIYVRRIGITLGEARAILNRLTTSGKIPEPLRIAKLLARTLNDYASVVEKIVPG